MPRGRPRRTITTRSRSPAPPRGGGGPPSSSAASSVASAATGSNNNNRTEEGEDSDALEEDVGRGGGVPDEDTAGGRSDDDDDDDDSGEGERGATATTTGRRTRGRGAAKAAVPAATRRRALAKPKLVAVVAAATRKSTRGRRGRKAAASPSGEAAPEESAPNSEEDEEEGASDAAPPPPRSTRPRRGKKDKVSVTVPDNEAEESKDNDEAPDDDGNDDLQSTKGSDDSSNHDSDEQEKSKVGKFDDDSSSGSGGGGDSKEETEDADQEAADAAKVVGAGTKRKRGPPTRSSKRGKRSNDDQEAVAPASEDDLVEPPTAEVDPAVASTTKDAKNEDDMLPSFVHGAKSPHSGATGTGEPSDVKMDESDGDAKDPVEVEVMDREPGDDASAEQRPQEFSTLPAKEEKEVADESSSSEESKVGMPSLDERIPRKSARRSSGDDKDDSVLSALADLAAMQEKVVAAKRNDGSEGKSSPTGMRGDVGSPIRGTPENKGDREADSGAGLSDEVGNSKSRALDNKTNATEVKDESSAQDASRIETSSAVTGAAPQLLKQTSSSAGELPDPNEQSQDNEPEADLEARESVDPKSSNDSTFAVAIQQDLSAAILRRPEEAQTAEVAVTANPVKVNDKVSDAVPPAAIEGPERSVEADHPKVEEEELSRKRSPEPIGDGASSPNSDRKITLPADPTPQDPSTTLDSIIEASARPSRTDMTEDRKAPCAFSLEDTSQIGVDSPKPARAIDSSADTLLVETTNSTPDNATPTKPIERTDSDPGGDCAVDPLDADHLVQINEEPPPEQSAALSEQTITIDADEPMPDASATSLSPTAETFMQELPSPENKHKSELGIVHASSETHETETEQNLHGLHSNPECSEPIGQPSQEEAIVENIAAVDNSSMQPSSPTDETGVVSNDQACTEVAVDQSLCPSAILQSHDSGMQVGAIQPFHERKRVDLQKVKLAIFSIGCKAHGRMGYERRFEEYWSLLASVIHGDALNLSIQKHRAKMNSFLITKKLRKLHNKLVLGLLDLLHNPSTSYQASSDFFGNDLVSQPKRVPVKSNTELELETVLKCSYSRDELQLQESVWRLLPYPSLVSDPISRIPSPKVYPVHNSFRIPGAMAVDPYVRSLAAATGMKVSENAVWLIVVAMKEFIQTTLKSCIQMKVCVEAGQVPPVPHIRQRVLHKKRDIGDHRMHGPSQKLKSNPGNTCITALDVFALTNSMSIGNARSIGGTISRPAFELSQFSSYGTCVQPYSTAFDDIHSFITSKLSPSLSMKVHCDQATSSELDSSSQKSRSEQTNAPNADGSVKETTNKSRAPHGGLGRGAKDLGALRARSLTQRSAAAAAAAAAATASQLPAEVKPPLPVVGLPQTRPLTGASEPVSDKSKAESPAMASNAEEEGLRSSSPSNTRSSPQPTSQTGGAVRRGKGFGVKNLAAMRARSITKPADDSEDVEKTNTKSEAPTQAEQQQTIGDTPTETS